MGSGIAQVCAEHGLQTILFDPSGNALDKARLRIGQRITTDLIEYTSDINDCVADLIIEAIIEDAGIKAGLFNTLASINGAHTIFTTNTSSLSVTSIAEKISAPQRFAGMHFFNPATVMKLVEVVSTSYTLPGIIQTITDVAESIGKTPVLCKDAPGFIVNHVARPYYLESLYIAEKGIAGMETIDALMEASGFKMGPFRLMDLIGNDINYSVSCIVYDALGKPGRLAPSSIQEQKVKEGRLGRKTGKGYYEYPTR